MNQMLRVYVLLGLAHVGVAFRKKGHVGMSAGGNVKWNESASSHFAKDTRRTVAEMSAVDGTTAGVHKETSVAREVSAHQDMNDIHKHYVGKPEHKYDMIDKAKFFNDSLVSVVDKARTLVELYDGVQHEHRGSAQTGATSGSFAAAALQYLFQSPAMLAAVVICFVVFCVFSMSSSVSPPEHNVQPPAPIEVDQTEDTDPDPTASKSTCLPYAKQMSSPSLPYSKQIATPSLPYVKHASSPSIASQSLPYVKHASSPSLPYAKSITSPSEKSEKRRNNIPYMKHPSTPNNAMPYGMPAQKSSEESEHAMPYGVPLRKGNEGSEDSHQAMPHGMPAPRASQPQKTAPPQAQMDESSKDVSQASSSGFYSRRVQNPYGAPMTPRRAPEQDPDANADASEAAGKEQDPDVNADASEASGKDGA